MNLIEWLKQPVGAAAKTKQVGTLMPASPARMMSPWGFIRESFTGAWQKNVVVESPQNIMAFSAVYACVSLIADDISKLRIMLTEQLGDTKIWQEVVKQSPLKKVLVKPNRYQTRNQFLSNWMSSKLMTGNMYALKERDNRGVVTALYILNPMYVTPLVAEDGSVYYQLSNDRMAGVLDGNGIVVPAKEIIHDRMCCLWHPLVGVSPIFACGSSATQGMRIQANSAKFFENMSRPSGQITGPNTIDDVTAARFKEEFEKNFSAGNIGRLLVAGDGLKYEPMSMTPMDSQLIEQLKWTGEDVARAFHVPPHKIGLQSPAFNNVAALNQDFYSQTLQTHIEAIEILLTEGLELPSNYVVELDLEGLLRMDPLARAQAADQQIKSGVVSPNEVRERENLPPVKGGETPYLQSQNYSLAALYARDTAAPAPQATAPNQQVPGLSAPSKPDAQPVIDGNKEDVIDLPTQDYREIKSDEELERCFRDVAEHVFSQLPVVGVI